MSRDRILRNAIQCLNCDDVIESTSVHDFRYCSCGKVAVDGGRDYLRRIGHSKDYHDLSEVVEIEDVEDPKDI